MQVPATTNPNIPVLKDYVGWVLTLLVVYLSYWFAVRNVKDRADEAKRDARRQLATGLLLEIRNLEYTLWGILDSHDPIGENWIMYAPLLNSKRSELAIFDVKTLQKIYDFHRQLEAILGMKNSGSKADHVTVWRMKGKANFAIRIMRGLKTQLEAEGGLIGDLPESKAYGYPMRPPPPDRVFPRKESEEKGEDMTEFF